jgi:hypothetical protein
MVIESNPLAKAYGHEGGTIEGHGNRKIPANCRKITGRFGLPRGSSERIAPVGGMGRQAASVVAMPPRVPCRLRDHPCELRILSVPVADRLRIHEVRPALRLLFTAAGGGPAGVFCLAGLSGLCRVRRCGL